MNRRHLSKREVKQLNERLSPFGIELSKKESVEEAEEDGVKSYLVNGTLYFFEQEGALVPHLKLLQEKKLLKTITVDMGAIKFVTNGADVMRPGITAIEKGISEGEVIAIIDETHGKPLAVGRALLSGEAMEATTEGKVVASLHFVGDERWKEKSL